MIRFRQILMINGTRYLRRIHAVFLKKTINFTRFEGPPVRFSDFPRPSPTAPPTLGQHTDRVLSD